MTQEIPIEILGYIIEFSIGLAGFSGVIAVFKSRSQAKVDLDRWRIRNLLLFSMGPAFLCFIAIALLEITSSEVYAWRLACIIQSLFLALLIVIVLKTKGNLTEAQSSQINMPVMRAVLAIFPLISVVLFLTGLDILEFEAFLLFYVSLVLVLLAGVYQFFRAVLEGLEEP